MDRKYWFWLNNIEGIGNAKIRFLLEAFGTPEDVFWANVKHLSLVEGLTPKDVAQIQNLDNRKKQFRLFDKYITENLGIWFPTDEKYPQKLKEIYDKPQVLYSMGELPEENKMTIAIVGSRNCSAYGHSVAMELGRILGEKGVNVISGMAHGIDGAAHQGALLAGGKTYGILAGGVDKCYPQDHFNLYMDLIRRGGILSEYPPGTRTVPGLFPMRNRIISGLSDRVIVVEAGRRSGSLITANYALEQNRSVMAVPGRIGDRESMGCNDLIAQGAEIVLGYEELLEQLGIVRENAGDASFLHEGLASDEKMLYSLLLDFTSKSLESLIDESHMEPGCILTGLINLEIKGLIREIGKNFYIRLR